MNIAIDYDGTISSDKDLFSKIIKLCKEGHNVYVVTGRSPPKDTDDDIVKFEIDFGVCAPIAYCSPYILKKEFMRKMGINIDIWMDNEPGTIESCKILEDDGKDELL
jgi:hypothetical protein